MSKSASAPSKTSKKKKTVRIVLLCIFIPILLFIFAFEGILLVEKYIKKSPVPMVFGYAFLNVLTGSMNGNHMRQGDMIIVKRTNDYELGDIVTFIDDRGEVVTHRLVNYANDEHTSFITKGDANRGTDRFPITLDQIQGEVVFVIPKLGLVFDWFLKGGGIIYLASAVIIVVIAVFLLKRKPESETEGTPKQSSGAPPETDETPKESHSQDENEQS